jgi:hypothetical protein
VCYDSDERPSMGNVFRALNCAIEEISEKEECNPTTCS